MVSKSTPLLYTLNRLLCDWGWTHSTRKPNEEFHGAPSPLWNNPAPRLFLYIAILALLVWLAMLGVMVVKVPFDIVCETTLTNVVKDLAMAFMLIDCGYLFRMSSYKHTDDRHWSRCLVIMSGFTIIYLTLGTILVLIAASVITYTPTAGCESSDSDAQSVSGVLAAMVYLYALAKVFLILRVTMKLYFSDKYLSRNVDPI